jgi:hypothetical protein
MAVCVVAAGPALAQDQAVGQQKVCPGFEKEHRVGRWDVHPFAEDGAESIVALQEQFEMYEADLRGLLEAQGLGHVADPLFETVRSGTRIDELEIQRGQTMRWMAFRKKGEPMAITDVCVASRHHNGAFEISVPVVTDRQGGNPRCALDVDCDGETAEVSVDASGSSPGVRVTMDGPEGTETLIDGSGTTWNGSVAEPYTGSYTFTATAEAEGTETVTTYVFVVPKVCLNLGLVETSSETRSTGTETCTETASPDPLCVAPPPECDISVTPSEIRAGESVDVNVTGHWAENGLELQVLDEGGDPVSKPAVNGPSDTVKFSRAGTYTIAGTATNEAGETATCEAGLEVNAAWAFRFFGAWIDPDDDEVRGATTLPGGVPFRGHGNLDSGYGVGAGFEYFFNDRWGLEGRGLFGQLDSEFTIDIGQDWALDDDTLGYWELSFGPNLHLTPSSPVDFYIGPFVGYGSLDDGEYSAFGQRVDADFDGDLLWGAQLGLDWPFGTDSQWGLHLGARYTDFSVDVVTPVASEELGVDPLSAEIGLTYWF